MEVHPHSHTERKKFKHYLWEFLMLFLAVFAGFWAENLREHTVEHRREKQYIVSLVKDLIQDTINITEINEINLNILKGKDSLIRKLLSPAAENSEDKELYRLFNSYATNFKQLSFTDRTISQLKSSGGLRLIRNQQASDSISEYYRKVNICETQGAVTEIYSHESNVSSFEIFNAFYRIHPHSIPPVLLTKDKSKFMAYTNHLSLDMSATKNYLLKLITQKAMAMRLIDFLKMEYHLK